MRIIESRKERDEENERAEKSAKSFLQSCESIIAKLTAYNAIIILLCFALLEEKLFFQIMAINLIFWMQISVLAAMSLVITVFFLVVAIIITNFLEWRTTKIFWENTDKALKEALE